MFIENRKKNDNFWSLYEQMKYIQNHRFYLMRVRFRLELKKIEIFLPKVKYKHPWYNKGNINNHCRRKYFGVQ